MIVPVGKRVAVRALEEKNGHLILSNAKPTKFSVVALGDEATKVKEGDVVFIEKHYGIEVEHDGVKTVIIDESTIIAKLDA